ncbi:MAG: SBBP repeat-containing protein [Deltaproteobacteria bacterium]|nr:SBBP repeat-containing protein [Deltaproteobacteria bacterium]
MDGQLKKPGDSLQTNLSRLETPLSHSKRFNDSIKAAGRQTPLISEEKKKIILTRAYKIQIPFILNQGQVADENVRFYARTFRGNFFVTKSGEMGYCLPFSEAKPEAGTKGPSPEDLQVHTIKEKLLEASPAPPQGRDPSQTRVSYFLGNDPAKWQTHLPVYNQISLGEVYPKIDLHLVAHGNKVEKIFTVRAGGDPQDIKLAIESAGALKINPRGELEICFGQKMARFSKPIAFQEKNGKKEYVQVAYGLDKDSYGFKVGMYDRSLPLTIDPTFSLVYSTYLGGNGELGESGEGIAVDNSGNAYITGFTSSSSFPTQSPIQGTFNGGWDVFVAKINPSGSVLVYSTFLGGSGYDYGYGITVDSSGNVYVTGQTDSGDFPIQNPIQGTFSGGWDVFVTKIDPTGSALVYSTYLGGSGEDWGKGIAVDNAGNACVTGQTNSNDFPIQNPIQGTFGGGWDAFITKIDPTGSVLVYSTFLGGSGEDWGNGIALDPSGNAYIAGETNSADFPVHNPIQGTLAGSWDAFLIKINPSGSAPVYSTFLGGSAEDHGNGIAVDGADNAYVTGYTTSNDFPTLNPIQGSAGGSYDAFISKINPAGSALVYSTYLRGWGEDWGKGITVDSAGNAYVTGYTDSIDFPTLNPIQGALAGSWDAFIAKINPAGSALVYSTYLGGSDDDRGYGLAVDPGGNVYVTGYTVSSDFPTQNPIQGTNGGNKDVFILKISESISPPPAPTLTSPADGATGLSTSPTLNWAASSGADSYRIQVSTDSSFAHSVADQAGITSLSYPLSGLSDYSTYYWQVNATSSGGTSGWSSAWHFTTADPTAPTGSIQINGGAASTTSPAVTLSLTCNDSGSGCSQMQFSNDNVTYSAPEAFAVTRSWTLSSGSGPKTVYVKFKDVTGNWSSAYSAVITLIAETISTPNTPSGSTSGTIVNLYTYSTGGSTSSFGHSLQYLMDWGDGTDSGWLAVGTTSASKSWASAGNYTVKVMARCALDTGFISSWSSGLSVSISLPDLTISGTVTAGGSGLGGVMLTGLPGSPITAAGGSYSATVSYGWSGTVTPVKTGYTFTPPLTIYAGVTANQTQHYSAARLAYTITVVTTGPVTVTSTPAGINCGTTCTGTFNTGSEVILDTGLDSPTGYIKEVRVDGVSIGAVCSIKFTNLSADHQVVVVDPYYIRNDFNGDGKADILWQQAATGQLYLWFMDGLTPILTGSPGGAPPDFEIKGIGDFNGDGFADILWRDSITGEVNLWEMNGVSIVSWGSVGLVSDLNWEIKGVGDLNGDGKYDILWRHVVTGEVYVWLMNGAAIASQGRAALVSDLNWEINGVGDFNGDGKADILWRHATIGQIYIWQMRGLTAFLHGPSGLVGDLSWKIHHP